MPVSVKQVLGVLVCLLALLPLAGCDQLGIETPDTVAQRKLAEAQAIGSACRHAERAIEDCYLLNPKAEKAAIFGGWREMDEYMRENKMEGVKPAIPRTPPVNRSKAAAEGTVDSSEAASRASTVE